MKQLTNGLLRAGAELVLVFPVLPRKCQRPGDVSSRKFSRHRWLANRLLAENFRDAPAAFLDFSPSRDFLASDGVYPSAAGWRALEHVISRVLPTAPAC